MLNPCKDQSGTAAFRLASLDSFTPTLSLSKSDFLAGLQCPKLLWLRQHEPEAPELQPDRVLQDLFDQGRQVGELARARLTDGILIPQEASRDTRVRLTAEAIAEGHTTLFEGAFESNGVFVATDLLVKRDEGWQLIEVKSASSCKEEHILDTTVQRRVLESCGVTPARVEVMHLNKDFEHPDTGDLFGATDVTQTESPLPVDLGETATRFRHMLAGPMPDVEIGAHCNEPRECPFHDRCWPNDEGHISRLYNVGKVKTLQYMAAGVHRIDDLPPNAKLPHAAQRQRRAMATGTLVVEPGLARDLEAFAVEPLGFLDFETISRAVPVWPGMSPWGQAAAQFSYHESIPGGGYRHQQFLAEGPADARPRIAERLVEATQHARRVVTYSAFEKTQIRALARAVPTLAGELLELEEKLVDLLPVVRNNVYHPKFHGSFSIKFVLPAMVPDLDYTDLVIVNGLLASVEIARLLFVADRIPAAERDRVRQDLYAYCQRDTWATVRLLEELRRLVT